RATSIRTTTRAASSPSICPSRSAGRPTTGPAERARRATRAEVCFHGGGVMFRIALTTLAALAVVLPPAAPASQFVDHVRSRVPVALRVDGSGRAMVYYRKGAAARHVLVTGAVNARAPSRSVRQVRFRIDYSGGWRSTGHGLLKNLPTACGGCRETAHASWKNFPTAGGAYDGPALPAVVAACKASNGSYWTVQEWMVDQPNFGVAPWLARQRS